MTVKKFVITRPRRDKRSLNDEKKHTSKNYDNIIKNVDYVKKAVSSYY